MNIKRIGLIIAFVIMIIAFAALIYFVFIRDITAPTNTDQNTNTTTNVNGGLPTSNTVSNVNRQPTVNTTNTFINIPSTTNVDVTQPDTVAQGSDTIAQTVVIGDVAGTEPTADGSGIRYYDRDQGKFFETDGSGTILSLSDQIFPQADSITWSPTKNQAIITYPDDSKLVYDFETQNQITLPREWNDIKFDPSGNKIAFKNEAERESDRWLAISNPDGSEIQLIEPLGDNGNNVSVNWSPTGQVVATYRQGYSATAQEIFLVGTQGENFKSITTSGRGFEGQWSPDGSQLLYSVYYEESRFNPVLYLVDAAGDVIGSDTINLGLQTWSFKCAFANGEKVAYCAVPRYLETGTGIVPEYAERTNDTIYRIDTNNGLKSVIALPAFLAGDQDYEVSSLVISNDDRILYFTDEVTGNVYSIQLQ